MKEAPLLQKSSFQCERDVGGIGYSISTDNAPHERPRSTRRPRSDIYVKRKLLVFNRPSTDGFDPPGEILNLQMRNLRYSSDVP